jgi:hypothetical protein
MDEPLKNALDLNALLLSPTQPEAVVSNDEPSIDDVAFGDKNLGENQEISEPSDAVVNAEAVGESVTDSEDEQSVDVEDEFKDLKGKGRKLDQRVRQLVGRTKKAEEMAAQTAQQMQYQQAQLQNQFQQQMQQMQYQNQQLQQQLAMIAARRDEEAVERNLTGVDAFKHGLKKEYKSELEQALSQKEQFLLQQLQQVQSRFDSYIHEQQRRENLTRFKQETARVRNNVLAKDLLPEDAAKMENELDELVATTAAAYQYRDPQQAAFHTKKTLEAWYQARKKAEQNAAKQKVQRNQAVPKAAAGTRAVGTQVNSKSPSLEQIRAAGFENKFEWRVAGSPRL